MQPKFVLDKHIFSLLFGIYVTLIIEGWLDPFCRLTIEYNIILYSLNLTTITLRCISEIFVVEVLVDLGYIVADFIQLNHCRMFHKLLTLLTYKRGSGNY